MQSRRSHRAGADWTRDVFKNRAHALLPGPHFQSLKGRGFKSNYCCVDTGEDYWISGPKRRGGDALYGGGAPIEIDEDVREEYWRDIRGQPKRAHESVT